uniref:Uncharacterized protein n=1 Tax=Solanum tuberosum TaxID=4113 RepID=M1CLJ7_SOLTU
MAHVVVAQEGDNWAYIFLICRQSIVQNSCILLTMDPLLHHPSCTLVSINWFIKVFPPQKEN